MFGLEKEESGGEPIFSLEEILSEESRARELKERVFQKTRQLKERLRCGKIKDQLGKLGVLLYGYTALEKVIERKKTHV